MICRSKLTPALPIFLSASLVCAATSLARAEAADAPRATRAPGENAAGPASSRGPAASPPGEGEAAATAGPEESAEQVEVGSGLFEQGLAARSGTDAVAGPAPAATAPFTLSGYMRGDVFVGKVPGYQTGTMKAAYGELSLMAKTAKQTYGDGFAETRVRYGLQGDQQQTFLDLREAYVNTYLGPVDLRFGRQIIVWGRADALNPTNNLTPLDLRIRSPIEDDRRLGNFAARASLRLAPLRLEGVWLPIYLPSELPPVGIPDFVAFGTPRFPAPELKNGLLAGRVHLELPSFEMSVSYLHGHAPLPGVTLSRVTLDPTNPQVLVSRTAYIHHVVGIDFSTAIGDLLAVRGEAAYRRPVDYENRPYAPRPDLQYALGADRSFGPVSVIAQYLGRYAFNWEKQEGSMSELDPDILRTNPDPVLEESVTNTINRQLARTNQILFAQPARVQHLATVRLEWLTAHDTLSIMALGMVNVTTREWLAAPRIGYRISDALTTYVGAEIFSGPEGTLFGLIEEVLSAGYGELRYTF